MLAIGWAVLGVLGSPLARADDAPLERVQVADRGLREGLLMGLMSDEQPKRRRRKRGGAARKPVQAPT